MAEKKVFFLKGDHQPLDFFFWGGGGGMVNYQKKTPLVSQTAVKSEEIIVSFKEGQVMTEQDFNQPALSSAVFKAHSFP